MEYDNIYEAIFIEKKSNMCKKKKTSNSLYTYKNHKLSLLKYLILPH